VTLLVGKARVVDPRRAGEDGAPPGLDPCAAAESVKESEQRRAPSGSGERRRRGIASPENWGQSCINGGGRGGQGRARREGDGP
jgi:hypothetical protein